jgi:DNA phosphorothioation-associated putative methyltransferase
VLEPFMAAVADLGRLPEPDEYPDAATVAARFGSLKRSFRLVQRLTGPHEWDAIRQRRTEDVLVYLALARFRRRPRWLQLPCPLQRDLRAFFGAYTRACRRADNLLFQAGQTEAIDAACRRSPVGKLLPNALYVHRSALDRLDPLLRIYEGCGRAYLGEVEGANVRKLHRFSGKLSYLIYPDFDTDPTRPYFGASSCRCVPGSWNATTTPRTATRPSCTGRRRWWRPTTPCTPGSRGCPSRKSGPVPCLAG